MNVVTAFTGIFRGCISKIYHLVRRETPAPHLEEYQGRRFSFLELKKATKDFSRRRILGKGGFGVVYEGKLRHGIKVAVKRRSPTADQGTNEFRTEIGLLSQLHHSHLVSLIGYCDEMNEMILVYEYVKKGTLRSHLYGPNRSRLSWDKRLKICIGAAKGLHYLHTSSEQGIIHRDVKSSNILLDANLVAKVSDFGLSKIGPELDQSHVSTAVKGSFGYLDPEYYRKRRLTKKSDVYSFGVVLLEVLCARLPLDNSLSSEKANLSDWGMLKLNEGRLEDIIDPVIKSKISPASLKEFVRIVEMCLAPRGAARPSMDEIVDGLDMALRHQSKNSATSRPNHPPVASGVAPLDIEYQ